MNNFTTTYERFSSSGCWQRVLLAPPVGHGTVPSVNRITPGCCKALPDFWSETPAIQDALAKTNGQYPGQQWNEKLPI